MTEDIRPGGPVRTVEAGETARDTFVGVLEETIDILEGAGVDYVVMGGIAVAVLARPRWTHDIDLFLRPRDARSALRILGEAGYETEETDPMWLFKAHRSDVAVDLIFRSAGNLYYDDTVAAHAVRDEFNGVSLPLISREDLLVVKASANSEGCGYHWFDALALLTRRDLDWDYLLQRARRAARRVLSLLVYAQSEDIAIPTEAIAELSREVYGAPITEVAS